MPDLLVRKARRIIDDRRSIPAAQLAGRRLRRAVVAVTASLLAACGGGSGDDGESPQTFSSQALFDPVPTMAGGTVIIPFPFDGLFAGFRDPTLNIPNEDGISFVSDVNEIDGFSTTADAFLDVAGRLDYGSLPANLVIIDTVRGAPLAYGTDLKDSHGGR